MNAEVTFSNRAGDEASPSPARTQFFERAWVVLCPPASVIVALGVLGLLGLEMSADAEVEAAWAMSALLVAGMALLSTCILLDRWAIEKLRENAANTRQWLALAGGSSFIFLTAWAAAEAGRVQHFYASETIVFVCLPTLFICGVLLWSAISALECNATRVLLLAAFLTATLFVAGQGNSAFQGGPEDHLLTCYSLLVALAFALRLGVWIATDYRRN